MGKPGEDCGGAHVPTFCYDCGKPHVQPHRCDRWACPDCWQANRSRALRRTLTHLLARDLAEHQDHYPGASARAWARQILDRDQLTLRWTHAIASLAEDTGQVHDPQAFKASRSQARELAKEGGFEGFLQVPHPYRIATDLKAPLKEAGYAQGPGEGSGGLWRAAREDALGLGTWEAYAEPGPHHHLLGHNRGLASGDSVGDSEDVFKHIEHDLDPEHLKNAIGYLLTHTGLPEETLHRTTYAGDVRNNAFSPEHLNARAQEILAEVVAALLEEGPEEDSVCESCGSENLRSIWEVLDVLEEQGKHFEDFEHGVELERAWAWTCHPDDILDPPPDDPTVEELTDWIETEGSVVYQSDLPHVGPMPEPRPSSETKLEVAPA